MKIIPGSSSKDIAKDLTKKLNCELVNLERKRFPDGELYVRIKEDISGEDVVIVQTTYPDEKILELFLLQDAAKEAEVNDIIVVIPYYGYARQDKRFEDGEPVSAKALAKLISFNASSVITVDPHKEYILDFFDVPATSCSAVKNISRYLKDKSIDMILAPDKGALERAEKAASIIECSYDYLEKKRIDGSTVEIQTKSLDVKNKNVAIIDDIISTGGTMAESIKQLNKQGANKIFACCTHGLFADGAINRLKSAGCNEIISTDTIQNEYSKVKSADCISNVF